VENSSVLEFFLSDFKTMERSPGKDLEFGGVTMPWELCIMYIVFYLHFPKEFIVYIFY